MFPKWGCFSLWATQRLMHAFITSTLNYCNALLSALSKNTMNKLQLIQNSAAQVSTRPEGAHYTYFNIYTLADWLIDFKILLLVYKALHDLAPDYISEMLLVHEPGRALTPFGSSLLVVPHSRTKTFGDAAFSHCESKHWNSLLEDQRGAGNIDT